MEDNSNVITLTDENGNNTDYELLDIIKLDDKIYTVLYPTVEGDTEVLILRVEDSDDVELSEYVVEQDEEIVNKVYAMFKEKYSDRIKFED